LSDASILVKQDWVSFYYFFHFVVDQSTHNRIAYLCADNEELLSGLFSELKHFHDLFYFLYPSLVEQHQGIVELDFIPNVFELWPRNTSNHLHS
jgi:hypothetical protein